MPKRKVSRADYIARRSLFLPEKARFDWIMQQAAVSGADLPKLVTEAMTAIEAEFEALLGVLPKDYGIFETRVLEDLMRQFNGEQIKHATGDVIGRTTSTSSRRYCSSRFVMGRSPRFRTVAVPQPPKAATGA